MAKVCDADQAHATSNRVYVPKLAWRKLHLAYWGTACAEQLQQALMCWLTLLKTISKANCSVQYHGPLPPHNYCIQWSNFDDTFLFLRQAASSELKSTWTGRGCWTIFLPAPFQLKSPYSSCFYTYRGKKRDPASFLLCVKTNTLKSWKRSCFFPPAFLTLWHSWLHTVADLF